MGGTSYRDSDYFDRAAVRAATNTPVFKHDDDVRKGKTTTKLHPNLDPKLVAGPKSPYAGKVMRESRDSSDHPESLAIGVIFDETGSMNVIPRVLQTKLPALMNLLIQKGYVAHPQILFGAIGDANPDGIEAAPLQIGQFESGLEMEDCLSLIYLEGIGGGQHHETYELAHYFFLHHTSTDCWEKRGQKGYLFTIGDEAYYDYVRAQHVNRLIGDTLEEDLPTAEVVAALTERWNVFHIHCQQGSYRDAAQVLNPWKTLLGERLLLLEDHANVAELIGITIGLTEGTTDIDTAKTHLVSVGADARAIDAVTKALVPYAATTAMVKGGVSGRLPAVPGGGSTERL